MGTSLQIYKNCEKKREIKIFYNYLFVIILHNNSFILIIYIYLKNAYLWVFFCQLFIISHNFYRSIFIKIDAWHKRKFLLNLSIAKLLVVRFKLK